MTADDHAEHARAIVAASGEGALATMARDPAGYPFVSIATYALDERGRPLMCLSDLAEHAQNLAAGAGAALLAAEDGRGDSLARGRVTLIGDAIRLGDRDRDDAAERYRTAHPGAGYVAFADFHFWRLEVKAVRYVGGFGRMSWVDPRAYEAAR